jgi:uncharacterized protein
MKMKIIMKIKPKSIVILILALVLASFVFPVPGIDGKMIPLYIGPYKFRAEIADTPEKRAMGLMFREFIPNDYGMLFIFPDEDIRSFWMKNCKVHLDIIYLDSNKQVVDIHADVPPCKSEPCTSYISKKPARYVLELRGKRAEELDLKTGDSIFFILGN